MLTYLAILSQSVMVILWIKMMKNHFDKRKVQNNDQEKSGQTAQA